MASNSEVKIKLQGHEKFPLREGWLNKGIIMVEKNPNAFHDDSCQSGTMFL